MKSIQSNSNIDLDLATMTSADMVIEYKLRENLKNQMVGTLYPSILQGEMNEIKEISIKRFGISMVITKEDLEKIQAVCKQHNIYIPL